MAHPGAGQEPLTGPTGPARAGEYPTYSAEHNLGFERLVFLSDGVFAIAITLSWRWTYACPNWRRSGSTPTSRQRILGLAPRFLVYALSFLIIAGFWMEHHRMFHHIER